MKVLLIIFVVIHMIHGLTKPITTTRKITTVTQKPSSSKSSSSQSESLTSRSSSSSLPDFTPSIESSSSLSTSFDRPIETTRPSRESSPSSSSESEVLNSSTEPLSSSISSTRDRPQEGSPPSKQPSLSSSPETENLSSSTELLSSSISSTRDRPQEGSRPSKQPSLSSSSEVKSSSSEPLPSSEVSSSSPSSSSIRYTTPKLKRPNGLLRVCTKIVDFSRFCGYLDTLCYIEGSFGYNQANEKCQSSGLSLFAPSALTSKPFEEFLKNATHIGTDNWINGARLDVGTTWFVESGAPVFGAEKIIEGPNPGNCLSAYKENGNSGQRSRACDLPAGIFCEYKKEFE
ncbi:hypothetical protein PVAND_015181 [Polypedilum vanderplanki]|uniref:C-type lectin domain-containing protein n=1 Tax=Polypedilum vanderplanki TaxID=319348 RepID=A0A9J6BBW3_POLVA|nr:hypothetical protein PVAND_015181 [Polypedilum vanderplanki]